MYVDLWYNFNLTFPEDLGIKRLCILNAILMLDILLLNI